MKERSEFMPKFKRDTSLRFKGRNDFEKKKKPEYVLLSLSP